MCSTSSSLLDRIEITGAVITADAQHAQHAHAGYLRQRGAHYLLVKRNQPGLHAQLAALRYHARHSSRPLQTIMKC